MEQLTAAAANASSMISALDENGLSFLSLETKAWDHQRLEGSVSEGSPIRAANRIGQTVGLLSTSRQL